jgi:hypothetical protein
MPTAAADIRSKNDGAARSLSILSERIGRVDEVLRRTLSEWPAQASAVHGLASSARWVCTGAGGSEGPARAMTSWLRGASARASFLPLSSFAIDERRSVDDRAQLVVFSQALSPNARLALACREQYEATVLVTAVGADAEAARAVEGSAGVVLRHPPEDEGSLLVRLMGPAAATAISALTAAELAGRIDADARALEKVCTELGAARERARAELAHLPVDGWPSLALVTGGGYRALVHGLRWKLLESLGIADPPVWDVLQVAHGPFQQFYETPMLLCALELPNRAHTVLFDRLQQMLVPGRHRLLRFCASTDEFTAWFEHDAMLNELVLAFLRARPRDLIDWPGKGADASLYRFGPESLPPIEECPAEE